MKESMKELENIDLDEIRNEMENVKIHLDSVFENIDQEMDMDMQHEAEGEEASD